MRDALHTLVETGAFAPIDDHLARTLGRMGGEDRREVLLAVALASRAIRLGHVCLDLRAFARPEVEGAAWPETNRWLDALRSSRLVGDATSFTPFVLEEDRLYLRRYFDYETRVAAQLSARVGEHDAPIDGKALRASLDRLFPRTGLADGELDRQRLAALVAVTGQLCVVSGGPGTGKTYTVAAILALLAEQAMLAGRRRLHATLVAPTGKAAARLSEAILERRARLDVAESVRAMIPEQASTIHRALGTIAGSASRFRHGPGNPLATDVLVVDEASMVDLALMSHLLEALPPHARLVLLGDRNQLASVEAGAVFGDLCGAPREPGFSRAFARHVAKLTGDELPIGPALAVSSIADCVVQLQRNYRYPQDSGIATLARAINDGDVERATAALTGQDDVQHFPSPPKGALGAALRTRAVEGFAPYLCATDPTACVGAFGKFRVLAAHRRGPWGVVELNARVTAALAEERMLQPAAAWYERRPILVTENDYQVGLFNGDVAIALPDPDDDGALRAWFFTPDGTVRKLAPSRLPPHETVFAMTVHKAQGSEFDEVAIVLPAAGAGGAGGETEPGGLSPILTRELLYTAVTRPRRRAAIFADASGIAAAVARPIARASGLRGRLWLGA